MEFDRDKMYVVEGDTLRLVQRVMTQLYSNGAKRLTDDEMRDSANALNAHLCSSRVVEYESEGVSKPGEKGDRLWKDGSIL